MGRILLNWVSLLNSLYKFKIRLTIKMNNKLLLSVSALSFLSGCASITGSPNQSISIQTREQSGKEVVGATCDIINKRGTWFITSPGTASIHRSNDDIQITCRKDGLEHGRASVVSDTKGSMFGNILFGGGIGAIVDHNNGSAYEYPTFVQVFMGTSTTIGTPKKETVQQSNPMTGGASSSSKQAEASDRTQKLAELKSLHDQGLISNDIYSERQKVILENNSK